MVVIVTTDGRCTSYTGSVCQSSISRSATVFIKASVNINDSDAVIERWLKQVDESSSCHSAARMLLCHHVYPPCDVRDVDADGTPQTQSVCRQVSIAVTLNRYVARKGDIGERAPIRVGKNS